MSTPQQQAVIGHLRDSIKTAYQQALDADTVLNGLASENLAQFESVLKPGSGFNTEAVRFKPYVEELGQDLIALEASADFNQAVQNLTRKLALLLQTLARFKTVSKQAD
ncbi:prephenate dehydrogenase [Gallaecimonas mangrovi]|uniref:prephenate dehydrogenase n=1 Tax=Gallaecimonas mangrovi TaxID=2291597 RepID=UPI000E202EF2|nr:prephenate dehydrogenase [Gallaecimonas mangrovi]